MAKADNEANTAVATPAIPKPEWLFLDEAVALVLSLAPTLAAATIQAALGCALEEDRLCDRPVYGIPSHPDVWRQRIAARAVNWNTGEICFMVPRRDGGWVVPPPIRPQLPRPGVLKLFGITEAQSPNVEPNPLVAAIGDRLRRGEIPGSTATWNKFCHDVRTDCDAFIGNPKEENYKRGFSDDNIQRLARGLMQR